MKKITLYTKEHCPYCVKAKELFSSLEVDYEEVDVIAHPEKRQEAIEQYNWYTVPIIVADGQLLGGYDDVRQLHEKGDLLSKIT